MVCDHSAGATLTFLRYIAVHIDLPHTVTGPAIIKAVDAEHFYVGSMPLVQTYICKGETVTLTGTGTVAVVSLPEKHVIKGGFHVA